MVSPSRLFIPSMAVLAPHCAPATVTFLVVLGRINRYTLALFSFLFFCGSESLAGSPGVGTGLVSAFMYGFLSNRRFFVCSVCTLRYCSSLCK
jgi:hypothetical protein